MMRPVFVSPMDNVVNYPELFRNEENISFYPNPADDLVLISNKEVGSIEIYDLNGRLVNSLDMAQKNSFKVENLLNGIYLLKFKFKNGEIKVEKLIVQHH
jgi:myo-inositol-hexaphosphate 3-phosphohydrolase